MKKYNMLKGEKLKTEYDDIIIEYDGQYDIFGNHWSSDDYQGDFGNDE